MKKIEVSGAIENIPTYMTFGQWEEINTDFEKKKKARVSKNRKRRALYFRKQRMTGATIAIASIICMLIGHFADASVIQLFGIMSGIAGLYTFFTRNMMIVDEYYLDVQNRSLL